MCVSFLIVLATVVLVLAHSISTPIFLQKDGRETSRGCYTWSEKDILINEKSHHFIGWVTFPKMAIDFSKITLAKLTLYVKEVQSTGTLEIHPLNAPIKPPEDKTPLSSNYHRRNACCCCKSGYLKRRKNNSD